MTANVDIVNRALQSFGSRTTVTAAELVALSTNEAIQANLVLTQLRDQLLRMAPWNCATDYANLALITATPGTPENTTVGPLTTWAKGIPPPPWAYEYQFPVACLRPLWVIPQFNTGFASGVPITTAVTGGAPSFWLGPPAKFKVTIDQFLPVTSAVVAAGGTGHAVGDVITLASGAVTSNPIGAPVQLTVATIGGGGAIATVTVVNQIAGSASPLGGSYFAAQTNPVAQDTTTGVGVNATFTLTFGAAKVDQRVILTNQEFATLAYIKQITDPNVMDPMFQEAWANILGARLVKALSGDKAMANLLIGEANNVIAEARKVDANEGLTINDVTPDWIRDRGINYPTWQISPNTQYDWGPMFSAY